MLNSQFSSEGARIAICGAMREKVALSDQLEERLVEFAAKILGMAGKSCNTFQGRHMNSRDRHRILVIQNSVSVPRIPPRKRVHKMRIVQKELNETSVW